MFALAGVTILLQSCAVRPKGSFESAMPPVAPDYGMASAWAALPDKDDPADKTPPGLTSNQANSPVDVFFLHPTTYTGDKGQKGWNGPIDDAALNKKTDGGSILYQASLFNGAGRVFAPRYRQAHLSCYYTKEKDSAHKAFELAYEDVKAAFSYYLEHYNQGRPFIIATHSQGTTHGMRLIKEMIDGTPLQKQLVVAYLVGIPVPKNMYANLKPCENENDTGCFCSWQTYKRGRLPRWHVPGSPTLATNPLIWTTLPTYAPKTLNQGAVLIKFDKIFPQLCDAEVHDGMLWIRKPKFPGSFLIIRSNYHAGDYNLFYMNVRNNAQARIEAFLKKK